MAGLHSWHHSLFVESSFFRPAMGLALDLNDKEEQLLKLCSSRWLHVDWFWSATGSWTLLFSTTVPTNRKPKPLIVFINNCSSPLSPIACRAMHAIPVCMLFAKDLSSVSGHCLVAGQNVQLWFKARSLRSVTGTRRAGPRAVRVPAKFRGRPSTKTLLWSGSWSVERSTH